jgi:hypothetical protein
MLRGRNRCDRVLRRADGRPGRPRGGSSRRRALAFLKARVQEHLPPGVTKTSALTRSVKDALPSLREVRVDLGWGPCVQRALDQREPGKSRGVLECEGEPFAGSEGEAGQYRPRDIGIKGISLPQRRERRINVGEKGRAATMGVARIVFRRLARNIGAAGNRSR